MFPWGLNRRSCDPAKCLAATASMKSLNRRKPEGHAPKILRFEQDWPSALQTLPGEGDLCTVTLSVQRHPTEAPYTRKRQAPRRFGKLHAPARGAVRQSPAPATLRFVTEMTPQIERSMSPGRQEPQR